MANPQQRVEADLKAALKAGDKERLSTLRLLLTEVKNERIRRGAFTSVPDLEQAIMDYLDQHNADPKPFVWTASADAILEKVARAKQALESQH